MRLATWNVNSLNKRLPRVEEWLEIAAPDVLCLQETKLADNAFPQLTFEALGYEVAHHGQGQWNGVAILSKVGLTNVTSGFEDLVDPYEGDARLLTAECGGIRMISVYVPNGREVGSDFYERKRVVRVPPRVARRDVSPDDPLAIVGDFNVAPEDRDVWSPKAFVGSTHVTEPERAAVAALEEWGLVDAFRPVYDQDGLFTYWDYRRGDFHQHRGMRIDLALVTQPVADRVTWALVDRNARKGKLPSDHTPLVIDLLD